MSEYEPSAEWLSHEELEQIRARSREVAEAAGRAAVASAAAPEPEPFPGPDEPVRHRRNYSLPAAMYGPRMKRQS